MDTPRIHAGPGDGGASDRITGCGIDHCREPSAPRAVSRRLQSEGSEGALLLCTTLPPITRHSRGVCLCDTPPSALAPWLVLTVDVAL